MISSFTICGWDCGPCDSNYGLAWLVFGAGGILDGCRYSFWGGNLSHRKAAGASLSRTPAGKAAATTNEAVDGHPGGVRDADAASNSLDSGDALR